MHILAAKFYDTKCVDVPHMLHQTYIRKDAGEGAASVVIPFSRLNRFILGRLVVACQCHVIRPDLLPIYWPCRGHLSSNTMLVRVETDEKKTEH